MQKVSKAYKESMKSTLRERAYIMLSFGMVNQEAQAKATVERGEYAPYANVKNIFGQKSDDTVYATLEENLTPVDGSTFFLPRNTTVGGYYDTGLVSEGLISDKVFTLTIALNTQPTDFKGLTINFGENYPVEFDLVTDAGQQVEVRNNTLSEFTTEEVFSEATSLSIVFRRMRNLHSRARVYSIRFGYGLVYYNNSVINSSLDSYVSPIGAEIPQIDFTVTLTNHNRYFDVDNPDSAVHFLETGQEMDIYYGYQLPNGGGIEWVRGNHLLCSDWEADETTATIRCHDVFRNMDSEYYRGRRDASGRNYYDIAVEVLQTAGVTDYYIDPRLKNLSTQNPLPRLSCKAALQIIANACRCVLTQSRSGQIQITSNFVPDFEITSNGETAYSNVGNIKTDPPKSEYANLSEGYTVVDGGMFFIPRASAYLANTGYVSSEVSDASGAFATNPMLTIQTEAASMYYGLRLTFGQVLPSGMIIRTYAEDTLVDTVAVTEDFEQNMVVHHQFDTFNRMEIEFTGTAEPHNRIVLNRFAFGDVTDFSMTKRDMTSYPKATKLEMTKEVIVPCYSYQQDSTESELVADEITVAEGEQVTFFLNEASYGYQATVDGSTEGVTVVESGDFFVVVQFANAGKFALKIVGHRYKIVERTVCVKLQSRGKTVRWENPLISDMEQATDLARWIADYYSAGVEYEYDTRGNPELDANDVVYQESDFKSENKVIVTRSTLNFAQSFSGKVTTRRWEG